MKAGREQVRAARLRVERGGQRGLLARGWQQMGGEAVRLELRAQRLALGLR